MNTIKLSEEQIRVLFKILSDIKFESVDEDFDKYVYSPIFNDLLEAIGKVFYQNFNTLENPFKKKVYLEDKWTIDIVKKRYKYLANNSSNHTNEEILKSILYPFHLNKDINI